MSDPREKRIVVGDFRTDKVVQIGRTGAGPGEYLNAVPLRALAGDSSLMVDTWSRRWQLLHKDRLVSILSPDQATLPPRSFLVGVDTAGFLLVTTAASSAEQADSSRLLRIARSTGKLTEIARLAEAVPLQDPSATTAWQSYERAIQTRGGWSAVVRVAPYRVDWISPQGTVLKGGKISVPIQKVTAREKLAYMKYRANGSESSDPGTISVWPSEIPPVEVAYPIVESPTGELLIPRTRSADHPTLRYDVVNRAGKLVRQVEMPPRSFLIGAGRSALYSVSSDENDLQYLRKHRW